MVRQLCRTACLAVLVSLAVAAVALAAGPRKGATYRGKLVQDKEPIALKVSRNGRSVTVSAQFAPLYCFGVSVKERQITKPARIGRNRSFSATITYEFVLTHKQTAKLFVSGRFNGRRVSGVARSAFPAFHTVTPTAHHSLKPCDGTTTFSAKAR
jgi:hypothetical protein